MQAMLELELSCLIHSGLALLFFLLLTFLLPLLRFLIVLPFFAFKRCQGTHGGAGRNIESVIGVVELAKCLRKGIVEFTKAAHLFALVSRLSRSLLFHSLPVISGREESTESGTTGWKVLR